MQKKQYEQEKLIEVLNFYRDDIQKISGVRSVGLTSSYPYRISVLIDNENNDLQSNLDLISNRIFEKHGFLLKVTNVGPSLEK